MISAEEDGLIRAPFQATHLSAPVQTPQAQPLPVLPRVGAVLALLFAFLLGVKGLGDGFRLLSGDLLSAFFASTENPFVGLVIGLLATTLVQSSSVTTSMIVGLVAAPENPLPLANAIPHGHGCEHRYHGDQHGCVAGAHGEA